MTLSLFDTDGDDPRIVISYASSRRATLVAVVTACEYDGYTARGGTDMPPCCEPYARAVNERCIIGGVSGAWRVQRSQSLGSR